MLRKKPFAKIQQEVEAFMNFGDPRLAPGFFARLISEYQGVLNPEILGLLTNKFFDIYNVRPVFNISPDALVLRYLTFDKTVLVVDTLGITSSTRIADIFTFSLHTTYFNTFVFQINKKEVLNAKSNYGHLATFNRR